MGAMQSMKCKYTNNVDIDGFVKYLVSWNKCSLVKGWLSLNFSVRSCHTHSEVVTLILTAEHTHTQGG